MMMCIATNNNRFESHLDLLIDVATIGRFENSSLMDAAVVKRFQTLQALL